MDGQNTGKKLSEGRNIVMEYSWKKVIIACMIVCLIISIFLLVIVNKKTGVKSISREEAIVKINEKLGNDLFFQLDILEYQYEEEGDTIHGKLHMEKDKLQFAIKSLDSIFTKVDEIYKEHPSPNIDWWNYDEGKVIYDKRKLRGATLLEKRSLFNIYSWFDETRGRAGVGLVDSAIIIEETNGYTLLLAF